MPSDKKIYLKDIIENGLASDKMTKDGKAYCLTARYQGAVWWNSIARKQRTMVRVDKPISKYGLQQVGVADLNGHDLLKRVYSSEGKSPTLNAHGGGNTEPKLGEKNFWRKLTPLECERLQTVDDNYTQGVSNTQRYKMIGNGWTIDVVAHILKNITKE